MSKGGPKFREFRVWQKGKEPCGLHLSNNKYTKEKLLFKEIEKGCIEISSMHWHNFHRHDNWKAPWLCWYGYPR
jgi:hypothetical protein